MVKLIFATFLALASAPEAFAFVYVQAQGTSDLRGNNYSLYSASNTTVGATRDFTDPDGTPIHASFGSQASIGVLKAYGHIDSPFVFYTSVKFAAAGNAQYFDTLHVTGSGPVTLHFSLPTTGTVVPNSVEAGGLGTLEIDGDNFGYKLGYELSMLNGVLSVVQNNTAMDLTVDPGTAIDLRGTAHGFGRIDWSVGGASGADFYHTSTTLIDVLTPGGGYTSDSGHIYALPGLAGDFNADGKVDAADYVVWRKGLGPTYQQTDYDVWRAHFGQTAGSGSGAGDTGFAGASVPESSSGVLLFAGACLVFVVNRCIGGGRRTIVRNCLLILAASLAASGSAAFAGSGTWKLIPNNGDWNLASNWTSNTVPNGATDTATFSGATAFPSVALSGNVEVNGVVFGAGTSTSYTIITSPAILFTISGAGITNNANISTTQSFTVTVSGAFGGLTRLTNSASGGNSIHTVFTSNGGDASGFAGGTTQFRNTSTAGFATFNANAGAVNGALGGIVEFRNNATGGNGTFTAKGGAITNSVGGIVQFFDSATAGSGAFTTNGSSVIEGNGALTQFFNNSSGGSATFVNNGGTAFDASGGVTQFLNASTAGSGAFINNGNTISDFPGLTRFRNTATAGTATFNNNGGGITVFGDSSSAASGRFFASGGSASNANSGLTQFANNSTAASGTFIANSATVSGGTGGYTAFFDAATAGSGIFTAKGSSFSGTGNGTTQFNNSASAGSGTFNLNGGSVNGAFGGQTNFYNTSTADSATFTNLPGTVAGAGGGQLTFYNSATAATSTYTNAAATVSGADAGATNFRNSSTAATSTSINEGSKFSLESGGVTVFHDNSDAGSGLSTNHPGQVASALGGFTYFYENASAGARQITNEGAEIAGAYGGFTNFNDSTTAAGAVITNNGGRAMNAGRGRTNFSNTATAGTATITNVGGAVSGGFGGATEFFDTANADHSVIHNQGITVDGASGGSTFFYSQSSAGSATLYADSGIGSGGGIVFNDQSDGGTARVILDGAGLDSGGLDISQITKSALNIGSIEGGGIVSLGSKQLTVGGNNLSTTFDGLIRDGGFVNAAGGSLTKAGSGTLSLTGAETYTGGTTVSGGALAVNGSILGDATVNSGATLQGTGTIAGNVNVAAGGILSPGNSPGILTVGSLTLNSDSLLDIELSGSAPGSQYDAIVSAGNISLGGTLQVVLIDGFAPLSGESFEILEGSLAGTFSTLQLPALAGGLTWNTSQLYTAGVLSVGLPGDYNGNSVVDAADYVVWRKGLGTVYTQSDYDVWRAHFGQTAGSGAVVSTSQIVVPEPSSTCSLLLASVITGISLHGRSARCGHRPESVTSKEHLPCVV